MPPKSLEAYSVSGGPAIWMETLDHKKTKSWGHSRDAIAHRQEQAELIAQGNVREAIQMDIDDIRSLFGSKYDEHIRQMLATFGFSE